jgi:hypothetical protein
MTEMALASVVEARARRSVGLVHDADQVLDVVADLVRDDVGAGEVAFRTEPALEGLEEVEVEIDPAVARAVERPDRRVGSAAGGVDDTGEEDELGRLVAAAAGLELALPDLLGVGEHDRDEGRGRVVGADRARRLGLRCRGDEPAATAAEERGEVDAEEEADDDDDDGADAADAAGAAGAPAHAAAPRPRTSITFLLPRRPRHSMAWVLPSRCGVGVVAPVIGQVRLGTIPIAPSRSRSRWHGAGDARRWRPGRWEVMGSALCQRTSVTCRRATWAPLDPASGSANAICDMAERTMGIPRAETRSVTYERRGRLHSPGLAGQIGDLRHVPWRALHGPRRPACANPFGGRGRWAASAQA